MEQAGLFNQQPQRVRLLLTKQGKIKISHQPLQETLLPVKLALYDCPLTDNNRLRFHKTDPRPWLQGVPNPASVGIDDWLFSNTQGELTESTIANLVVQIDSQWLTPEINSGLLPGTYRQRLLRTGVIREQKMTRQMLKQAEKIGLINSVRGWRSAILVEPDTGIGAEGVKG